VPVGCELTGGTLPDVPVAVSSFQYRRGLLSAHNRGLWLAAVPRARPRVDKRRLWADNETALVEWWQRSYVGVHTTRRSG